MMALVTHLLAAGIGALFAGAVMLPTIRRRELAAELRGTRLRVIAHSVEDRFREAAE